MTNAFYIQKIITILERELRTSFVKFGYADSDMYKNLQVYANKDNTKVIIRIPSYELFLEYGTKYIKSKKIVTTAIRKAKPDIEHVMDDMWNDFVKRVGPNLFG